MAIMGKKFIIKAIKTICLENKDLLAYLAATGKIENFIRDNLAYNLYKKYAKNYYIAREWPMGKRRIDIALLNKRDQHVEVLIELKATNTDSRESGSLNHTERHRKSLREQLKRISRKCKCAFGILLAVHPQKPLKKGDPSVKYHKELKGNPDNILRKYNKLINGYFKAFGVSLPETYSMGDYNASEISLIVHILGSTE